MFTSLFLTIGLIHLIALASPGPDFALILRTSLHRPTALGAALGIAIAILLHATLSLTAAGPSELDKMLAVKLLPLGVPAIDISLATFPVGFMPGALSDGQQAEVLVFDLAA